MEFYQFCPPNFTNSVFFATNKKLSINAESPHFPMFCMNAKSGREMVMEKYFIKSVGTLPGYLNSVSAQYKYLQPVHITRALTERGPTLGRPVPLHSLYRHI